MTILPLPIDHLVGAIAGDALDLTICAASFQKVDGCVLAKAVKGVFLVVTT